MYCKHCGKEIADDSKFCQHCGERQIGLESKNNELNREFNEPYSIAKDDQSSRIEVSNGKNINNIIADEIIGNLKMIGLAASFIAVYLLGFWLIHLKDISKFDYETKTSYYGESCYDPSVMPSNGWRYLHWEQHYYAKLYFALYNDLPVFVSGIPSAEECLSRAKDLEKKYKEKKELLELEIEKQSKIEGVGYPVEMEKSVLEDYYNPQKLKEEAKVSAARDIESLNWQINDYRKTGFINDLKKNAKYVTLICLIITILGRYIIKIIKWTKINRTV